MDKFEYRPSTIGASSVNMDGDGGFVGTAENVRSRQWAHELGKRDLMSAARIAREVDVDFNCDFAIADKLREVADADIINGTPGTFVAQGEWKQRGYILESQVRGVHFGWITSTLTIALLDGAWWKLQSYSFEPTVTPSGETVYQSATGTSVRTEGAAETGLHALTVYGESVQVGTPTPEAPVPISVVEPGNILSLTPYRVGTNFYNIAVGTQINAQSSASGITVSDDGTTVTVTTTANWNGAWFVSDALEVGKRYVVSFDQPTFTNTYGRSHYMLDADHKIVRVIGNNMSGDPSSAWAYTVQEGEVYYAIAFGTRSSTGTVTIPKLQFTKSSSALPYAPYNRIALNCGGTQTAIDLDGNFLASLPDGTRDELTVDSTGAVTLTKRVGRKSLVGTESWTAYSSWNGNGQYCYYTKVSDAPSNYGNKWPGISSFAQAYTQNVFSGNTKPVDACCFDNSKNFCVRVPESTAANFKTWLESNNQTVYYQLATEQTITLDPITMPDVFDNCTVEVVAEVVPTITAEWEMATSSNFDYPYNYSYDYMPVENVASANVLGLVPCKPRIVFYGAVTDPQVIIAGNKYKVTGSVPAGGRIEIDGRDKTVKKILQDGTTTNEFANALRGSGEGGGEYIFQPIPAGDNAVTWDGTFGVDIGWYEEVGEPPWSQS